MRIAGQLLGQHVELSFAVANQPLQHLPLPLCQSDERNNLPLVRETGNAELQRLQYRPSNAELVGTFGGLLQLALA